MALGSETSDGSWCCSFAGAGCAWLGIDKHILCQRRCIHNIFGGRLLAGLIFLCAPLLQCLRRTQKPVIIGYLGIFLGQLDVGSKPLAAFYRAYSATCFD